MYTSIHGKSRKAGNILKIFFPILMSYLINLDIMLVEKLKTEHIQNLFNKLQKQCRMSW